MYPGTRMGFRVETGGKEAWEVDVISRQLSMLVILTFDVCPR